MSQGSSEEVVIAGEEAGERLDRVLAARIEALSRSRLKALILDGAVAIGGRTILDPGYRVKSGEVVAVAVPPPEPAEPLGEDIPLKVIYEDDDLIVIDKPRGLVVHPAAGNWTGTLVNALIAHCGDSLSGVGGVRRPGIVHRLDKDTTGLMVVAKNDAAHRSLAGQFADHGRSNDARFEAEWAPVGSPESALTKGDKPRPDAKPVATFAGRGLRRGYLAFVWGAPDRPKGTIDAPLDRHPHSREKRAVRQGGREAVTHWEVLQRYTGTDGRPVASLLACRLETGRTHQIRVHLAHISHPLLGDATYGPGFRTKAVHLSQRAQEALAGLGRQALHAYLLGFEHPSSGEAMEFRSDLPADLARLSRVLTANGGTRPEP